MSNPNRPFTSFDPAQTHRAVKLALRDSRMWQHWDSFVIDEAQAVAETAKLGQEVVKATAGAGSWLSRILGDIPEDALGLLGGDWLHQQRRINVAKLEVSAARRLVAIEVERLSSPNPATLMPLLLAAREEADETLQDLWAGLLVSALADGGTRLRKEFVDLVRKMNAADAIVLQVYGREPRESEFAGKPWMERDRWLSRQMHEAHVDNLSRIVSERALTALALLEAHPIAFTVLTPFGQLFLAAVQIND